MDMDSWGARGEGTCRPCGLHYAYSYDNSFYSLNGYSLEVYIDINEDILYSDFLFGDKVKYTETEVEKQRQEMLKLKLLINRRKKVFKTMELNREQLATLYNSIAWCDQAGLGIMNEGLSKLIEKFEVLYEEARKNGTNVETYTLSDDEVKQVAFMYQHYVDLTEVNKAEEELANKFKQ